MYLVIVHSGVTPKRQVPLLPEHMQAAQHAGVAAACWRRPRHIQRHCGPHSLQLCHRDGEHAQPVKLLFGLH